VGRILTLVVLSAVFAIGVTTAQADPPSPDDPAGKALGIVPPQFAHGNGQKGRPGGNNLTYHGGPVLHANTAYAIYWVPAGSSVSANYTSLIDGFFQNVAADHGKTTNTYYSTTQYTDSGGNVGYGVGFAGSTVDTNAFPASGCNDNVATTTVCLTDAQLRAEINNVIASKGWPRGLGPIYFIFTPRNVGSCFGSSCAFTTFCAYHSSFGSGTSTTLYANQPYTMTVPAACDAGQHPNGDDADSTLNVVSHEHQEAMTDPLGNAWYDRQGAENADKCAWTFGTSSGTNGAKYNETINGTHYYLQQDWSNASSRCVQTGT